MVVLGRMTKSRVVVLVAVIAAVISVWWWRSSRGDEPASGPRVTQPTTAGPATVVRPTAIATAHLKVSVRDAKGPVANAAVRLAPDDGEIVVLRAGGDGVATSGALEPGTWRIAASAPDHEPAAATRDLRAGEDAGIELVLAPGGKPLTGLVTDVTGGPVAGARVDAAGLGRLARASDAVATTLTGSDGRYQLTVAMGQLLVGVSNPDYAPQARYVDVGPDGAVASFSLVPGAVIEGTVRDDQTKQPIAGAGVVGRRDRGGVMRLAEGGVHRAVSGSDGRFRLTGLRPGAYELSASRDRKSSRAPSLVGVGVAEQVTDVELLIGTLPVIRGVVVDERGAPVPALEVAARGEGPGGTATAGADGTFVLAGLRPGHYLITASGYDHVLVAGTPVALATADLDGVRVVVRRGVLIKGHVEPRQIAEVSLDIGRLVDDLHPIGRSDDQPPITTGPDGEFAFSPVSPGSFTVSARCPNGDRGKQAGEAAAGTVEVVVHVAPGASIAGRVVDGEGKAVGGVTVAASSIGESENTMVVNGMVTSGVHGITGRAGAFEIVGLAAGTYRLSVLERGRPMKLLARSEPVKLAGTDHKTGVELVVERPTGRVRGRVIGPGGHPLADAWVSVHQGVDEMIAGMMPRDDGPPGGSQVFVAASDSGDGSVANNELPPVLTDAQGAFLITGIPAGVWDVLAEAQAGTLRGRARKITPDATVEIQATGVTALAGTAHGPSGPPALFTVELDGPSPARRTFGGADGTFSFARLDAGDYVVRVTSSDGNGEVKVTVVAGAKATVDVPLAANATAEAGKTFDAGTIVIQPKSTGSGAAP
jgi:Carboxypeptidase regulatory-like domain